MVPERVGQGPSGGDRYDAAVAAAWPTVGRRVRVAEVPGAWPWPDDASRAALAQVLERQEEGCVVIDGLVACSVPEVVEEVAGRRPVAILVHSVLSEGAGATGEAAAELDRREARALAAAEVVVATSRFAADRLSRAYGLDEVAVALPGVDRAPLAAGSWQEPQLLMLGAITPLKNQGLAIEALEQVSDLPWSMSVVGPAPDPWHLRSLQHEAEERFLGARVRWCEALGDEQLEQVWSGTDLLLHPSRSETYGMVVVEAHARGIPTIVGSGTGAVEALVGPGGPVPGREVDTSSPRELAAALREWLTDAGLRQRWHDAAILRRNHLPRWSDTVEQLEVALARMMEG